MDIINYKIGKHKGYEYIVFYWERDIMASFNGYVRLPDNHPQIEKLKKRKWFKFGGTRSYSYRYEDVDVSVHGGVTFGEHVTKRNNNWFQPFTEGWWIGWDYMHAGDEVHLPKERVIEKSSAIQAMYIKIASIRRSFAPLPKDKVWTFEEVEEECKNAIRQLKKYES